MLESPSRIIEYKCLIEDSLNQLELIKTIIETKHQNISKIHKYIENISYQNKLSKNAQNCIYLSNLQENTFYKSELNKIFDLIYLQQIQEDYYKKSEIFCWHKFKLNFKNINKELYEQFLSKLQSTSNISNKLLNREFLSSDEVNRINEINDYKSIRITSSVAQKKVESKCSVIQTKENEGSFNDLSKENIDISNNSSHDDFFFNQYLAQRELKLSDSNVANKNTAFNYQEIEIMNENEYFCVSLPSIMLLEEEYLYKDFEFMNKISEEQKLYFDLMLLSQLLNDFNVEITIKSKYLIFFNNCYLFRLTNSFLSKISTHLKSYPKIEKKIKKQIDYEKNEKNIQIKDLDENLKKSRFMHAKALVKNIRLQRYLDKWKQCKLQQTRNLIEISIINKQLKTNENILKYCDFEQYMTPFYTQYEKYVKSYAKFDDECKNKTFTILTRLEDDKCILEMRKLKLKERIVELNYKFNEYNNIIKIYRNDKIKTQAAKAAELIAKWWFDNRKYFMMKDEKKIRKKKRIRKKNLSKK